MTKDDLMPLLKKEFAVIWIFLHFIGGPIFLGALLGCFKEDAWYKNYLYWFAAAMLLFIPLPFMLSVLNFQMLAKSAKKLDVSGSQFYLSPYIWLILFIVPIAGWIMLLVMIAYLYVMTIVKLFEGKGEKYII